LLFAGMEISDWGGAEWMGYGYMSADGMSTVCSGGVRKVYVVQSAVHGLGESGLGRTEHLLSTDWGR
jgi:hypothetical protein